MFYTELVVAIIFSVGVLTASGVADEPEAAKESQSYLRLVKDGDDVPRSLDAAIVSFRSADGNQVVDLIGALHVAEPDYYRELNRRFEHYDAVLYELVAPEGTRIPLGGVDSSGPVSMLQGGMTTALGLSYQLDEVDYTRENLFHADMSPEEFRQSMEEREESVGKIIFRAIGQAIAKQSAVPTRNSDARMLSALLSENREHELKVVLAEQFADLDATMKIYSGKNGSTLVTERNKKALSVLREQLIRGKKRIGIFYGAGHMSDMESRLVDEFGMRRKAVEWLTAWNLVKPAGTNE